MGYMSDSEQCTNRLELDLILTFGQLFMRLKMSFIACPKYSSFRDDLFQKCKILNKYFNEYGDEEKFIWIRSNEDIDQMNCLGTFITKSLKSRTK